MAWTRRRRHGLLSTLLTAAVVLAPEALADSPNHRPAAHLQRIRDNHARHHSLADRFLEEDHLGGLNKRALVEKIKKQELGNGTVAAEAARSSTTKLDKDKQTKQGYPGRYGQTTIALPPGVNVSDTLGSNSSTVLFIGGQVTGSGTYISNDVLYLSPRLPFAGPRSAQPNPVLVPGLSNGLPPRAWGTGARDAAGRLWVIGGVVEDCQKDAGAYAWIFRQNMTNVEWVPITPSLKPARRRQASLIPILRRNYTAIANHSHSPADTPPASPNVTEYPISVSISNDTAIENTDYDFVVPGGIAEPYTCSPETVAYLGVDRWSPPSASVGLNQTNVTVGGMPDPLPKPIFEVISGPNNTLSVGTVPVVNATNGTAAGHGKKAKKGPHPPITDYAMGLINERWVIIVGGQITNGTLARTDEVTVLDTLFGEWSVLPIAGVAPVPRMGLSLTQLSEGIFLLYGGLSSTLTPLGDSWLLDTTQIPWRWRELDTYVQRRGATSLNATLQAVNVTAPARGYHSAVSLSETEVLIAWGMGAGSRLVYGKEAFWQVTIFAGKAIWTRMGVPAILKPAPEAVVAPHKHTTKEPGSTVTRFPTKKGEKNVATHKSKASSHSRSRDHSASRSGKSKSKWSTTPIATYVAPTTQAYNYQPYQPGDNTYDPSSTDVEAVTPTASAQNSQTEEPSGAPQTKSVVAGVVSAFVASAAIIGGLMLYGRRKAMKAAVGSDPARSSGVMPPVTTLITRPANRRTFTFGTDSAKGTPDPSIPPDWATFNTRPSTPPPGLGRRMPTVAATPDATLQRHRALFAETQLPSNSPMPPPVAAARFEGGQTPLTGDGSPIISRRLELVAPSLRRASASRDSGVSDASVQSYPFLMSLHPQRSQSAMSESTDATHSSATITKATFEDAVSAESVEAASAEASAGHAREMKEEGPNPLKTSWLRRVSLTPGWGWSNAPAEGSALEQRDITEAATRGSIVPELEEVAPLNIRPRRSTKELRIANPELAGSPSPPIVLVEAEET